jgi:glyoxylase I family protein
MYVDHIAIACRDVERMRIWYERVLGFEVRAQKTPSRPDASAPTYLVGLPGSPTTLELMPDDRTPIPGRQPFHRGLSHVALDVDDLREWEGRLSAADVKWLGAVVEAVGGGRLRSFEDPEGNMLQIVQRTRTPG